MVNGIGNSSSYMSYLLAQAQAAQGSGGISQSEFGSWAQNMTSQTGNSIDTSNAVSPSDTKGNGTWSPAEFLALLQATMAQAGTTTNQAGSATDQAGTTTVQAGSATDQAGSASGVAGMPHHHHGHGHALDSLFSAIDSDSSGGISQSELDTWAQNMSSQTGISIDTTNAVSTYDTSGTGELSKDEFKDFLTASGILPSPPSPANVGATGGVDSTGTSSSSVSAADVISQYDTNGDGLLSATELQNYLNSTSSSTTSSTSTAASSKTLWQQALAAYATSFDNGQSSSLGSTLMNLVGTNGYLPIDSSA